MVTKSKTFDDQKIDKYWLNFNLGGESMRYKRFFESIKNYQFSFSHGCNKFVKIDFSIFICVENAHDIFQLLSIYLR